MRGENAEVERGGKTDERRILFEMSERTARDQYFLVEINSVSVSQESGSRKATEAGADGVMCVRAKGNTWHVLNVCRRLLSLSSVSGSSLHVFVCALP